MSKKKIIGCAYHALRKIQMEVIHVQHVGLQTKNSN